MCLSTICVNVSYITSNSLSQSFRSVVGWILVWIIWVLWIYWITRLAWIAWSYGYCTVLEVNFKDIVTVNSLVRLIIKVVRYEDIAFLFVVFNFSSWSSCKRNCLTKFTDGGLAIQVILSCIVNVGNLGYLRISMVCYCNFNILIAKLEGLFFNR